LGGVKTNRLARKGGSRAGVNTTEGTWRAQVHNEKTVLKKGIRKLKRSGKRGHRTKPIKHAGALLEVVPGIPRVSGAKTGKKTGRSKRVLAQLL